MTIAEWINNAQRSYAHGLLLYAKHGNNAAKRKLFESGENSFTRKQLYDALKEIESKKTNETTKPGRVININIDVSAKKDARVLSVSCKETNTPEYYTELKNVSFKEMAALHSQLELKQTQAERLAKCQRIDYLDSVVDACWEKLDYYKEHGRMPLEPELASVKSLRDIVALCKNIPTYLTKINSKLDSDKLTESQEEDLLSQKAKWTLIKHKIESVLDEPFQLQ